MPQSSIPTGNHMQRLIDDMKAIPGVIGACTYRSKEGIGNNNLPLMFKADRLQETAKHLAKIHAAGRLNFPDLTEVMLNYEEAIIVFRQINLKDHLITICAPDINMNLLAMSLNLAIENIMEQTGEEASPELGNTATANKPSKSDIFELLKKGPMAQPLQAMSRLLAKVIGPMAKIVFEDSLSRWVGNSETKKGSLSKLLEIICQEIGDQEKSKEYRDLVRQKMASRPKSKKAAT